jgi:hypothetical protein
MTYPLNTLCFPFLSADLKKISPAWITFFGVQWIGCGLTGCLTELEIETGTKSETTVGVSNEKNQVNHRLACASSGELCSVLVR